METLPAECEHIEIPLGTIVSLAACAFQRSARAGRPCAAGLLAADPAAERVWERLGVDLARLSIVELEAARERAAMLDAEARAWAERHPQGTIVEVGAGLSTRHARLEDLGMTYVAVDETPLAALREELFGNPLPYVQVAMSLEDRRWSRAVVAASREVLVLVPDAFVDLHPDDVVASLVALAAELPAQSTVVAVHGPRAQLCVAQPEARHASVEVRLDGAFGSAATAVRIPRLRWIQPPLADEGFDLPAVARLQTV